MEITNQRSKFRTRNWVEINYESWGTYRTYNTNSDIKFEMIEPNLLYNSDAYINVKGTITVPNTAASAAPINKFNEKIIVFH